MLEQSRETPFRRPHVEAAPGDDTPAVNKIFNAVCFYYQNSESSDVVIDAGRRGFSMQHVVDVCMQDGK